MKIKILPSALNSSDDIQYTTSYLIDETVAIDAGCLGLNGDPENQSKVSHVLLTHCHADHISSLPFFIQNTHTDAGNCVSVYCHPETGRTLSRDVFNDRIWPNYFRFASKDKPYLFIVDLEAEKSVHIADFRITPIPVNHIIPTLGYIVESQSSAVIFGADSGPTYRIWEVASSIPHLKAAFIEVTFPNRMRELALKVGHLTPSLLKEETKKLPEDITIIVTHIRPRYKVKIIDELNSPGMPQVEIGRSGKEYAF